MEYSMLDNPIRGAKPYLCAVDVGSTRKTKWMETASHHRRRYVLRKLPNVRDALRS